MTPATTQRKTKNWKLVPTNNDAESKIMSRN